MSKKDIKHNAKINNINFKIIEVENKYIVAKPIKDLTPLEASGAHFCFNTGNHHHDNFDGSKPVSINYTNTGSIFIASGVYVLPISVQNNEMILLPKIPISELNYAYVSEGLILSSNANGWVVALAKNKETIKEVKEKIDVYIKENIENNK